MIQLLKGQDYSVSKSVLVPHRFGEDPDLTLYLNPIGNCTCMPIQLLKVTGHYLDFPNIRTVNK